MSLLRTFMSLNLRTKGSAVEAGLLLLMGRLGMLLLPFRWLVRWSGQIGATATSDPRVPDPPPGPCLRSVYVARMVARVARNLPFEATCMPQALACTAMLRRRGISSSLVLGLRDNQKELGLEAHAWVDVGGATILGFDGDHPYQAVCRTLAGPMEPRSP